MLSCKNCGAQMSGTDLICKKCGTPWGKTHKSRIHIYISVFLILLAGAISYIYFNPNIDKTKLLESFAALMQKNPTETENNTPVSPEESQQAPVPPEETSPENNAVEPVEPTPEPPVEGNTPPVFPWVSASSSLKSQGKFSYTPDLTLDEKMETAWLEGVSGNGIGEYLLYSAETDQKVSEIVLYNGYLKNSTTYINNGRFKSISIEFSDGTIITKEIPKQTYNESLKGYPITLEEPINTTSIKITILDVYQGSYYTDTALSGISFH
ncbi:MAG: hypothetical protein J6M02_04475 [Clostridia bacterium]|nr:hypothetical protein [Clostridia bacterium]